MKKCNQDAAGGEEIVSKDLPSAQAWARVCPSHGLDLVRIKSASAPFKKKDVS